jgi:hypothetical protein
MIGYSPARGVTWGWEAGAGELGVVRVSTGGSYRMSSAPLRQGSKHDAAAQSEQGADADPEEVPPESVHYVAFEPLGLTLGVDFTETGRSGLMAGLWAGWILDPTPNGAFNDRYPGYSPDRLSPDVDCPDYDPEPTWLLSGALGVRYLGGEWEFYFTPKAVVFYCVEFAN